MKVGILSFRPLDEKASVEEIELKNEAKAMGHTARIFRSRRFQLIYDKVSPRLYYDGKPMLHYDVMITRPSILRNADLYLSLIDQMEIEGILLFNRYQPVLSAKNKVKTVQILDQLGIPVPRTVIVHRPEDLKQAAAFVKGFPLILKEPFGSFGDGVTIIESMRALQSFLRWDEPMYLLQEYVKNSRGKDIRIFVIGDKVVGAMMRSAKRGEFRSNIELGGVGAPVNITKEEEDIALKAVKALDLNYGGVDVMRGKEGPVVLEVNSNPGFKALEQAVDVNIAKALVEYAVEYVQKQV